MAKFGNSVCCLRVGIISSQVFGHLRSFKGWIHVGSRDVNPVAETEKQIDIISVAVVPSKQKLFVQPKLKNNNVFAFDQI